MTELMFHPARMGGYGYVLEEAGDAARTVLGSGVGRVLIAAGVALLIAFLVVGRMKAKLKTARFRTDAADYVRKNSLLLSVRQDHFLYSTEQRRRIEQPQNRQPMQKGR